MLTLLQVQKLFASAEAIVSNLPQELVSPEQAGTSLGGVAGEETDEGVRLMLEAQPDLPVEGSPEIATFVYALTLLRALGRCTDMACWASCRSYAGQLLTMLGLPPPEVAGWQDVAAAFVQETQAKILLPYAPDQLSEAVLSVIAPASLDSDKLKEYLDGRPQILLDASELKGREPQAIRPEELLHGNGTRCASHPDGWHRMGSAPGDSMDCLCGLAFYG